MKLFRKPWLWWCLGIGVVGLGVGLVIWAAYRFVWFPGKTPWDWLQLLIIPLALALIALVFNLVNTRTERQIAQKRYEQDKEITEQRYKQDKEITLDKQREDLLQAYLDRMSELLLEKGLRTSHPDAEVRDVARVRTMNVLIQLDVRRVEYVFSFLRESGLTDPSNTIVSLKDADLSGVKWEGVKLYGCNLSGVNLYGANLSKARLSKTWLRGASLSGTNLSKASLIEADLSKAALYWANLRGADLYEASLSGAILSKASLSGANLSRTNLSGTILKGAQIDKSQLTPEQIAQAIWD